MEIDVLSSDTIGNIFNFVTTINKTNNMTALVLPEMRNGYFVIRITTLDNQ